jgi:glutamate-1-semialdehyde 2,1-aminomutase
VLQAIDTAGVTGHFKIIGNAVNLFHVSLDREGKPSQAYRTLFLQELIRRGILAPSFIVSYSHSEDDIDRTIDAVAGSLGVYRRALENGVEGLLVGEPSKPVWRKFN